MTFSLKKSTAILRRTPKVLEALLKGHLREWTHHNEGQDTWSPYDIVGHLIEGEKTDWLVRAQIIMNDTKDNVFQPFDRFAQMNDKSQGSLDTLLKEFDSLRNHNLEALAALQLQASDFDKKGVHPELGEVTLRQLIATWAVHDLNHIAQISRVMAKQYEQEVGPWRTYLGVLKT
ncbi:DinB family protein [Pareuzebyella sediminis]|uniref:DinB family protein n=1 Tax=Pareuzebyella sediminis TaxID=2607998 RepID=UPI0011EEAF8B|nr:DinB family protein [Pareuzebyella sediminis]